MSNTTKTKPSDIAIADYLAAIVPDERQAEARALVQIFQEVTGFRAVMWAGMVGFGRYEYTYDSGHSGAIFATGFAIRKAEIAVYVPCGYDKLAAHLQALGKHRLGKSCLYIRRLDGVNQNALRALIRDGLAELAKQWTVTPA